MWLTQERRFADQLDRDYELMTYNQHPFQLFLYRFQNKYIKDRNEEAQKIEKGEVTGEQEMLADVE